MDGPTAVRAPPSIDRPRDAVTTVVMAVADEKGVSPLELEPLAESLDPELLERLVDSDDGPSAGRAPELEFHYADCHVTVTGDGHVTVQEPFRL